MEVKFYITIQIPDDESDRWDDNKGFPNLFPHNSEEVTKHIITYIQTYLRDNTPGGHILDLEIK